MDNARKIIAAGAGHGALSAAITLAKNGYDVTVYEKSSEKDIGLDWHDAMSLPAFDFAGIERLPKDKYEPLAQMAFKNPKKNIKLVGADGGPDSMAITIDRKELLHHLISIAENAGVKFEFNTEITGAAVAGDSVCGIKIKNGDGERIIYGDLVIDGCGVNSPVRRSLPEKMGILNEVSPEDLFYVYRAYYNKIDDTKTDPIYTVYFYHMYRAGLDWVITGDDFVDLLIGKFSPITMDEVNEAVRDFKTEYSCLGDEIIRGGTLNVIPIRKTLPIIVANGYAAIGDSACMTVPLNGSGIDLSLKAGNLLAGTVMSAKDNEYTVDRLWSYQYRYFKMFGNDLLIIDAARGLLTKVDPNTVDFFMENKILTEKEIAMVDTNLSVSAGYLISKLKAVLPKSSELLPMLTATVKKAVKTITAAQNIPLVYNEDAVRAWAKNYEG